MTWLPRRLFSSLLLFVSILSTNAGPVHAATVLPTDFEERAIISGLADPATMAFAPDGRLFIGERIQGRLRVAVRDHGTGDWTLLPTPFATLNVPTDGNGTPERHRSSGIRGFTFDPDFANNGYLYVFYMYDQPRHNRVVRLTASAIDPNVAEANETVLLDLPFASGDSSGSHNGGAIAFGDDGMLYVTTGDGWNGGDNVQSLTTYTGKVYRIAPDGTIPTDNPFYTEAAGDLRATYALGLRNPYSMSRHPLTGQMYINDVNGAGKTAIYELAAGANYGHDGFGGIGISTGAWAFSTDGGSDARVISGGVWVPEDCDVLPPEMAGNYVVSHFGSNGSSTGSISTLVSDGDTTVTDFATNIGEGSRKPLYVTVGPEGHLYYLASNYESSDGRVYEIYPTGSTSTDTNNNFIPDGCEGLLGDLNCDGMVNAADIGPFTLAIIDGAAYATEYSDCDAMLADYSEDDSLTIDDVAGLVAALIE